MGKAIGEARSLAGRWGSQSYTVGVGRRLGTVGRVRFAQDAGHVVSDGTDTDEQFVGDLLVAPAGRYQPEHFHFTLTKAG